MMINVQLEPDGPITQMDESKLKKQESIEHGETSTIYATEYWLNDSLVHRSVNVHLKKL